MHDCCIETAANDDQFSSGRYVKETASVEKGNVYESSLRSKPIEHFVRLSQRESVLYPLKEHTTLQGS